jgi:diguanylate cyclase (GGDEF)-like protein/PAS domain S-box-containing protein
MNMLVQQEKDIVYVNLAALSGNYALTSGTPLPDMVIPEGSTSRLDFLQVPIYWADVEWGLLQIQFFSREPTLIDDLLSNPKTRFAMLIVCVSFVGFYLILRRTLRHLDPSAVVPTRVKTALDGLEEGVVLLDTAEHIVLANNAFARLIGREPVTLMGQSLSEFPWKGSETDLQAPPLPWSHTRETSQARTDVPLLFPDSEGRVKKLIVNSTPILDDNGAARGVLVAFNDVTELDQANELLMGALGELHETKRQVEVQNKELHHLATRDPLTGCFNRRAFFEQLESMFVEAQREGTELCCIMTDIDHFKSFNDRFGHAVGDQVICVVVAAMRESLRPLDFLGRYGGEEFCIILPEVSAAQGAQVAERIRHNIERESGEKIRTMTEVRITSSFGVSSLASAPCDPLELIDQADKALYAAKESGRNRVIQWESLKTQHGDSVPEAELEASASIPPPALAHFSN